MYQDLLMYVGPATLSLMTAIHTAVKKEAQQIVLRKVWHAILRVNLKPSKT